MEQAIKVASLGSKRQPEEQSTSFSTPTRENSSSRQETSKMDADPIVGDLQVYFCGSTTNKDGEVWYKGTFSVTLSNKKRCRVHSNKED
jgi:hypothetical protein